MLDEIAAARHRAAVRHFPLHLSTFRVGEGSIELHCKRQLEVLGDVQATQAQVTGIGIAVGRGCGLEDADLGRQVRWRGRLPRQSNGGELRKHARW